MAPVVSKDDIVINTPFVTNHLSSLDNGVSKTSDSSSSQNFGQNLNISGEFWFNGQSCLGNKISSSSNFQKVSTISNNNFNCVASFSNSVVITTPVSSLSGFEDIFDKLNEQWTSFVQKMSTLKAYRL